MFVFENEQIHRPRLIVNFPTKRHWRDKSLLRDIEAGLNSLVAEISDRGIESIAIPALGSGLGGLQWPAVRDLMEVALSDLHEVCITIFEAGSQPAARVRNHRQLFFR